MLTKEICKEAYSSTTYNVRSLYKDESQKLREIMGDNVLT